MPNLNLQTIRDAIGSLLGQTKVEGDVDAIDLLKQDHRRVEQLGKDYKDAEDNSEKKSIATKILLELTVHAKLEEELVYPVLEKIAKTTPGGSGSNGADSKAPKEEESHSAQKVEDVEEGEEEEEEGEEQKEEIDEAYVEHHMVKLLIAELEHANPGDKQYDARVTVLLEMVQHHVKEEESELLPRLRASGQDMQALGEKLSQRKQQLLKQLEKSPRMSGSGKAAAPTKARAKAGASSREKSSAKAASSRGTRKATSSREKSPAAKGKGAKTGAKRATAKKTGKSKASSAKVSGRSSAAKAKTQKVKASSGAKAKSKAGTARKAAGTRKSTTTAKKSPTSKAKSRKK